MRLTTRAVRVAAAAACVAISLAACTSPSDTADTSSDSSSGSSDIASKEPDVNGDGKVVVGVLSPGDLNDNGYYESFVAKAEAFTKSKGWTLIKVGSINPADALNQARNLCRQKVDLVALGAAELKDAIPASAEDVCKGTAWYVPSSAEIKQTPQISISRDFINESLLAAGYANGLLMKDKGYTKAGYITGPELDFSVQAAKAFKAGIKEVVPNATLATTYTGDFNDSAKAKEAATAQINQGAKVVYPYLGGATDAVAALATPQNGLLMSTPGTDRCGEPGNKFAVSVIFDPGEYFNAALSDFADGKLKMGVSRDWHLGKDSVPTVKLCNGTADQNAKLKQFIEDIGSGKVVPDTEVSKLGG
ncbi:BMP family ABC transporter substrate-binding protein [Cryptosporangium phraense]|uniref:BMP family ABC transporter substrate-binding protein n=1 Tax=Cryptosporangium phraense TaxID=2593070 RepID=A0A545AWK6_9ACTN|nr:BMP family ABC transporter substrate-binding protein [Cryptosporangium phraense]TQS45712.1 BMP family ABC transporter substrate-binding protein [Cryptosporangium phraense]